MNRRGPWIKLHALRRIIFKLADMSDPDWLHFHSRQASVENTLVLFQTARVELVGLSDFSFTERGENLLAGCWAGRRD